MKKADLLKKIEVAKDEDDINELLKGTDIESTFKTEPTLDVFKAKLESDKAFKSFIDSEKDIHANKALETWKTNNLPTLINDEVLKATGKKKTPEQIKIEELERKFTEKEVEAQNLANQSKIKDLLTQSGFDPTKTIEFFNTSNVENVEASIGNFKSIIDEMVSSGVKKAIADGNYTPPGENVSGELTADDLAKMMM
ncbi:capsid assembly scaffolding protein Gp46 family protein [Clostridium diolis]|uniref:capsid assembly scaffolding protein Gp46 family protein n=1 Tax=Clostridium diolis TaxID=223919 RepID=UPI003AF94BB5